MCVSWFCDHRAYISDEQSAWMLGMLEVEENLSTPKYFLGGGLMRNILHQVSYLLDAYKKPTSIVGKAV